MKTVFVIAGLDIHQTATGDKYKSLRTAIAKKGYKVVPVDISWRQTTPAQFAEQFIEFYNKHKGSHNIAIGNSFGAVVAFIAAPIIKPDELVLCSMSAFFKEDLERLWPTKRLLRLLGKRRVENIGTYSANEITEEINKQSIKVKILYGELEHKTSPRIVKRSKQTAKMLKSAKLVEVADAPHSFVDPRYIKGIVAEF